MARGFGIAVFLFILGALGFAYSGIYDVSASTPHSGLVNWYLSTTSHAAIERRAGAVSVPDLQDDELVLAGASDFEAMCVGCHGAPGKERSSAGKGLNPRGPDLGDSADHMTAAELFWVTKHGIKMTGMPAWGATHADDSIWPVVAFMLKLPDMNGSEYSTLLASADGFGHHDSNDVQGHEHDHPEDGSARTGEAEESVPGAEQSADHHDDGHDDHTH